MTHFTLRSHAKINWLLRVIGKREDGFHDIETVFQKISLHDLIEVRESKRYELTCSDPAVPVDQTNLVTRAWRRFGEVATVPPMEIHLEKSIPAGGGLGGGSSNAAAVLLALRDRYAPELDSAVLRTLALELGSDVPFFLMGGTAYATGRGEELQPIESPGEVKLLLVLPEVRVDTAEAYRSLRWRRDRRKPLLGIDRVQRVIAKGPFESADELENDFEDVVFARLPLLGELRARLIDLGAGWARMSGSGSTLVGAFEDEESRERAAGALRDVRSMPVESLTGNDLK
jgi:4-diphosphocytidyl-2-C-methyl-D-erythritol kinase